MKLWVGLLGGVAVAGRIVGGAVLGSIIAAVPGPSVAVAQTASTIVVEGNRRVEADTIRSYFRAGPGERLDNARIDDGLKALYATGLFQDVRVNQQGGRLVVTVVESPVINRVAFEGNKRVKDDQLAAEVQSKPREPLSRPKVQSDVQRVVEIYRRNGRYDIRVNPKMIELPNNRVDLVFEIAEGDKTTVRQINFVGNRAFSDYRLKDVIKTTSTNILSFLKNTDIYDTDRIEADRDLLRRFYLTKGFADVRVVAAVAEFDPERKGFIVTFTIDEGEIYRFGNVDVQSGVRDVDPASLRAVVKTDPGGVYNAESIEKSVELMTIELSKRGYAFAQVRPRGDRNFEAHTINVVFVVEQGARAYIERINVRGNTRTRDYVIRREFDIAEGDAYNKVLIDRAERRLKNLNYFKLVRITNEPGSAPDRIVINVDLEEQPTGEFSVSGGYSTSDGFLAEVSVGERNLLGRGQFAKASVQYGEFAKGFDVSFVEPYFLGYRVSAGLDVFAKQTVANQFQTFASENYGTGVRFGLPLREDLSIQVRYNIFRQSIELDPSLKDGNFANGEATLALKQTELDGPTLVSSVGYSLIYNTLDSNINPHSGFAAELKQDFAGVGGDVNFIKTTVDARYFHEVFFPDLVGIVRLQGGHVTAWGGQQLRLLDHFFGGPGLVRGFAPNGFGPRDLTAGTNQDNIGGSMYWAASVELQSPIPNLPKDFGLKVAVFADAGSVFNYAGQTVFNGTAIQVADVSDFRSSVGAGLIWDSPFGPLRIDYAVALTKQNFDVVQQFRFGGGTKF
jgi:outer membrane protein insertion porin family